MSEGSIEYYAIEGAPGRYFKCPKGVGKLSDKSCNSLYTEAMSPKGLREGLRFQCRGCPVGAVHSGVKPLKANASRFLSSLTCARCIRPTSRLIRGLICVSCYNREREALIGKNAKGNKPVRVRAIDSCVISFGDEDDTHAVARIDYCASKLEALLSVTRSKARSLSFGFLGLPIDQTAMGAA